MKNILSRIVILTYMVGNLIIGQGCVGLTHEKYMKVKGSSVKRSADLSLSQIKDGTPLFGYGNKAVLHKDGVTIEFLSDPHYAKMVSIGLGVPCIPGFLFGATKEFNYDRVMYIRNAGPPGVVHIIGSDAAEDIMVRIPPRRRGWTSPPRRREWTTVSMDELLKTRADILELQPYQGVQLVLPESKRSELYLKINQKDCSIIFKESTGRIWHKAGI